MKRLTVRPLIDFSTERSDGWVRLQTGDATVYFRGYLHGRAREKIIQESVTLTEDAVAGWLSRLDGHFSMIVDHPRWTLAASDPVRSYPLIWAEKESNVYLTHSGPALEMALRFGPHHIDLDMAHAVALSGFTIGARSLYAGVRQIGPGEYIWIEGARVAPGRYHRWTPWQPVEADPEDLAAPLAALNRKLIDDLVTSARGRTILVPLSAGLDSRLVASGLREAGYEKVRCVSYGLSGNREAVTSRDVARRLGYEWSFVPYTHARMRAVFHSADYAKFRDYSDSLTGVHFPQEYRMLAALRESEALSPDTIVVNGQAGDFIAGNHIPKILFERAQDASARRTRIVDALLDKHYKLWTSLQTEARRAEIGALLSEEFDKIGGLPNDPAGDHGIYEYCEFQDRQSKYVLNGQRVYEYFGLDWRLPLWDRAYMDFWAKAPLAAKQNELLYRRVLERDNWGGVWKDIPTNPTRIRPGWMVPVRTIAKLLHAPLGRARWHKFEKRYLEYWMAATCAYAAWPWRTVASDQRGHANAISWHAAAYLKGKGIAWDGSRLGT